MQRDTVIVYIGESHDMFGTHDISSSVFSREYAARGYKVFRAELDNKEQVAESVALCRSGRVAFAHCEQSHGISMAIKTRDMAERRNIFELLDIPAFAHLRDYPFYPWVRKQFVRTSSAVTVFHIDKMAPALGQVMGSHARHKFLPHAYLDWKFDPEECTERKKQINLLWIGGYKDPLSFREPYADAFSSRFDLFDACVDACIDSYHTPIWESIAKVHHEFSMPFSLNEESGQNITFLINQYVRHERRRRIFLELSKRKEAVIVWAGPVPELARRPEAKILEKTHLEVTLNMINQARTMVMLLNNFSHGLSERLLSAMRRRCCVISSTNKLIEQTFKHQENILLLNSHLGNLDENIEFASDSEHRNHIVESAYETVVPAYSVSNHVGMILRECGIAEYLTERHRNSSSHSA